MKPAGVCCCCCRASGTTRLHVQSQPAVSRGQWEMKTAAWVTAEAPTALCLWAMNLEGWRFPPALSVTCWVSYQSVSPRIAQLARHDFTHLFFGGALEQCHFGASLHRSSGLACCTCPVWALRGPVKCICTLYVKCTPTWLLWTGIPLYTSLLSKTWNNGRIRVAAYCSCSPLLYWKKA